MAELKVGDLVISPSGKKYRIVSIAPVFGIPSADLIPVKKNGSNGIHRRKNYKNLPLSVLEKAEEGKPLIEIL